MPRKLIVQRLLEERIIAVVRLEDIQIARQVVEALLAGGISFIEITMTVPGAESLIREVSAAADPSVVIGVGSVLDAETVHRTIDAGARFVVSPVFKPDIVIAAHQHDVPVIPGAFTPTEIVSAHEAGADMVKVFPADRLGMSFFKSILAPMPQLRLIPTGGVTLENADAWLRAGACAVGIGSSLLDPTAIRERNFDVLADKARALVACIDG